MKKGEIVRATTGSHFDIPVICSTRMTVCESPCERRLNPKLVNRLLPRARSHACSEGQVHNSLVSPMPTMTILSIFRVQYLH